MWGSGQVCPMIFMLRWRSFNEKKYTHLWKIAIEIGERENFKDNFIHTLS